MPMCADWVKGGFNKGTMAQWLLPVLLSGKKLPLQLSARSQTIQFLLEHLQCIFRCCHRTGAQSKSISKSVFVWALQVDHLAFQQPSFSLSHNLHWFLQIEVMGTSFSLTGILGWGVWCEAGTPCSSRRTSVAKLSLPIFNHCTWGGTSLFYASLTSISHNVASSIQPQIGPLFSQISDGSQCSVVQF